MAEKGKNSTIRVAWLRRDQEVTEGLRKREGTINQMSGRGWGGRTGGWGVGLKQLARRTMGKKRLES